MFGMFLAVCFIAGLLSLLTILISFLFVGKWELSIMIGVFAFILLFIILYVSLSAGHTNINKPVINSSITVNHYKNEFDEDEPTVYLTLTDNPGQSKYHNNETSIVIHNTGLVFFRTTWDSLIYPMIKLDTMRCILKNDSNEILNCNLIKTTHEALWYYGKLDIPNSKLYDLMLNASTIKMSILTAPKDTLIDKTIMNTDYRRVLEFNVGDFNDIYKRHIEPNTKKQVFTKTTPRIM